MNAKQQIEKQVRITYGLPENAHVHVFKGYDMGTSDDGWHYVPFGQNAISLGSSKDKAIEYLKETEEIKDYVFNDRTKSRGF